MPTELLRQHARAIWDAAVAAVRPDALIAAAVAAPGSALASALTAARHIVVVGGGKAGATMSAALENALADRIDRLGGLVNVPDTAVRPLRAIRLHAARPAGSNEPTSDGVAGVAEMLDLVAAAGPNDVVVCLLSGGGSALLPCPAEGITLADKQAVTRLLHASGATIGEMNAVRKHLSRIKGGGLARACRSAQMHCLIISDVIGDPLDVIASGPTAIDPTTYADALDVLRRFELLDRVPMSVRGHLQRGAAGERPETLKEAPPNVSNHLLANNATALGAAQDCAVKLGYDVLNLGPFIEGETRHVATVAAGMARWIACGTMQGPVRPPACVLIGGETTVTLRPDHGKGGRNVEFVLAALLALDAGTRRRCVVLSAGTDGEDGPTDAAGAIADAGTLGRATAQGLSGAEALRRHDAYTFFDATGDLMRTGLTGTNVMDIRALLIEPA